MKFTLKLAGTLAFLLGLGGCLPNAASDGEEIAQQPITGTGQGILTLANARVRCGYLNDDDLLTNEHRLQCHAVVVERSGTEVRARTISPGLSLSWREVERRMGSQITVSHCQQSTDQLSQTCRVELQENSPTLLRFRLDVASLTETVAPFDEVLVPFTIETFGRVPGSLQFEEEEGRSKAVSPFGFDPAPVPTTYRPTHPESSCYQGSTLYFNDGAKIFKKEGEKIYPYLGSDRRSATLDFSHRLRFRMSLSATPQSIRLTCLPKTLLVWVRRSAEGNWALLEMSDAGPVRYLAGTLSHTPDGVGPEWNLNQLSTVGHSTEGAWIAGKRDHGPQAVWFYTGDQLGTPVLTAPDDGVPSVVQNPEAYKGDPIPLSTWHPGRIGSIGGTPQEFFVGTVSPNHLFQVTDQAVRWLTWDKKLAPPAAFRILSLPTGLFLFSTSSKPKKYPVERDPTGLVGKVSDPITLSLDGTATVWDASPGPDDAISLTVPGELPRLYDAGRRMSNIVQISKRASDGEDLLVLSENPALPPIYRMDFRDGQLRLLVANTSEKAKNGVAFYREKKPGEGKQTDRLIPVPVDGTEHQVAITLGGSVFSLNQTLDDRDQNKNVLTLYDSREEKVKSEGAELKRQKRLHYDRTVAVPQTFAPSDWVDILPLGEKRFLLVSSSNELLRLGESKMKSYQTPESIELGVLAQHPVSKQVWITGRDGSTPQNPHHLYRVDEDAGLAPISPLVGPSLRRISIDSQGNLYGISEDQSQLLLFPGDRYDQPPEVLFGNSSVVDCGTGVIRGKVSPSQVKTSIKSSVARICSGKLVDVAVEDRCEHETSPGRTIVLAQNLGAFGNVLKIHRPCE